MYGHALKYVSLWLLVSACLMAWPPCVLAAAADTVVVEAEGSGDSKMGALKEAWTNAVRQAAGMYTASRTKVLNDDLTEEIAAYSRGQINSFETLSESSHGGIWNVKIRAKVDRDVLKEMMSSGKSRTLKIDGASLVAQSQSASGRSADADEVTQLSGLMDFQACLDYSSTLVQQTIKGDQILYIQHVLKMDLDKFKSQARELGKLLSRISNSKETVALNPAHAREALKIIGKDAYELKLDWNTAGPSGRFLYKSGQPIDFLAIFYPLMAINTARATTHEDMMIMDNHDQSCPLKFKNTNPSIYFNDRQAKVQNMVCLAANASQAQCYGMNDSLFNKLLNSIKTYSVQFQVAKDPNFDDLIDSSQDIELALAATQKYGSSKHILFSPMLVTPQYSNYTIFVEGEYCVLICYQKLELTPEELLSIKDLSTRYVMK